MYLAIVFLPLLGCILAGAIAIAGARARFLSAATPHGAEDRAHDLGPHTPEPLRDWRRCGGDSSSSA